MERAARRLRSLAAMSRLRARLMGLWRDPDHAVRPTARSPRPPLVALIAIVVSGAAVRLTGSGMGCPTWPTCEDGSLVPRGATGANGWIEFLNRVFTGLVSIAVALAVLGARRRVPYRPDLTRWAWGLVAGVFAQALLGGLVVVAPRRADRGGRALPPVGGAGGQRRDPPPQGRRARGRPAGRPVATPAVLRGARALVVLAGLVLSPARSSPGAGRTAATTPPTGCRSRW